jgi:hypothetical protein
VRVSFAVWSNHIVWGDDLVGVNGDHIVGGDLTANHIVWGDFERIVWAGLVP